MLPRFERGRLRGSTRDAAAEATEIGERFGDRDLVAMGVMDQGHALIELGRTSEGLRLVDESMVAVTSGELSPIVTEMLYCSTIQVCQSVVRAATRAGVDHGADALVRASAGHGCAQGRLPRTPRRDHAGAGCVGGRPRGGPRVGGLGRAEYQTSTQPERSTSRANFIACGVTSTLRRSRIAALLGRAASHRRDWRCCDWLRARTTPHLVNPGCGRRDPASR